MQDDSLSDLFTRLNDHDLSFIAEKILDPLDLIDYVRLAEVSDSCSTVLNSKRWTRLYYAKARNCSPLLRSIHRRKKPLPYIKKPSSNEKTISFTQACTDYLKLNERRANTASNNMFRLDPVLDGVCVNKCYSAEDWPLMKCDEKSGRLFSEANWRFNFVYVSDELIALHMENPSVASLSSSLWNCVALYDRWNLKLVDAISIEGRILKVLLPNNSYDRVVYLHMHQNGILHDDSVTGDDSTPKVSGIYYAVAWDLDSSKFHGFASGPGEVAQLRHLKPSNQKRAFTASYGYDLFTIHEPLTIRVSNLFIYIKRNLVDGKSLASVYSKNADNGLLECIIADEQLNVDYEKHIPGNCDFDCFGIVGRENNSGNRVCQIRSKRDFRLLRTIKLDSLESPIVNLFGRSSSCNSDDLLSDRCFLVVPNVSDESIEVRSIEDDQRVLYTFNTTEDDCQLNVGSVSEVAVKGDLLVAENWCYRQTAFWKLPSDFIESCCKRLKDSNSVDQRLACDFYVKKSFFFHYIDDSGMCELEVHHDQGGVTLKMCFLSM